MIRTYGVMLKSQKHAWTLLSVAGGLWTVMVVLVTWAQHTLVGGASQLAGANMEGIEQRLGIDASALFAVSTTGTSTGAVDSMHDSYSPLGGGLLILNMLLVKSRRAAWVLASMACWLWLSSLCSSVAS